MVSRVCVLRTDRFVGIPTGEREVACGHTV